jgi:hypothetical protein
LHADFDGFEGTETDIGDEFGGGRTCEVNRSLVLFRVFLAGQLRVQVLEVFIEAIFRGSLHRVAEEGWCPTSEDPSYTFSVGNQTPCLDVALIKVSVDLATTFDEIEWCDCSMGGTLSRSDFLHAIVACGDIRKQGCRPLCKRHSTFQSTTRCSQSLPEPSRLLSRTCQQRHQSIDQPLPWKSQQSQ